MKSYPLHQMEALAQQILRGGINLYGLSVPELRRISDRLGRSPLSATVPKSYLIDRILSEVFSYADAGRDYPLTVPENIKLANLITYYPDTDQELLRERVLNGELEPLCCQLTIAQLEAISELLDIPTPERPMTEADLIATMSESIRLATLRGGFDVEDEDLTLEGVELANPGEMGGYSVEQCGLSESYSLLHPPRYERDDLYPFGMFDPNATGDSEYLQDY
ncbi:MAG: hypothetical protein WC208_13875 [Gallionella sp.]